MAKMDQKEIEQFLQQPYIAHLTVLDESNNPFPVPIWFKYEDGNLWLISNIKSKKIQTFHYLLLIIQGLINM